jgi:C_GCAxxG_C_C family probable redox protein
VGETLWGGVDDRTRMISTVFSGGLGGTRAELCGALSGGALLIGAQRGRRDAAEDNRPAKAQTARYREAFLQEFGMTICDDLRANGYGGDGIPCSALVAQAVPILLAVLEDE